MAIVKRSLGGFLGIDISSMLPVLDMLTKPTPASIVETFKVRCLNGC